MCLITRQIETLVASEDIPILKYCDIDEGIITSHYWNFVYKLGKLYRQELLVDNEPDTYFGPIVADVYAFDNNSFEEVCSKLTNVHDGLHALLPNHSHSYLNQKINIKGIIPKGSLYYIDETGLIVANQMILEEIIKK
jgi:hypothetical protein